MALSDCFPGNKAGAVGFCFGRHDVELLHGGEARLAVAASCYDTVPDQPTSAEPGRRCTGCTPSATTG